MNQMGREEWCVRVRLALDYSLSKVKLGYVRTGQTNRRVQRNL